MSGHSHWSTIRRKKEKEDSKRGKIFTKLAREIAIAVREGGGGDPEFNFQLRMAIDNAKEMNMPADNIERAIKRGTGEDKDGAEIIETMYEGYGPHGIALMIDVVTDNRNRTVAALRHALTRLGGNMGDPGSVAWQFKRKGLIDVKSEIDFDELFEAALDAGADDLIEGDAESDHQVYTDYADLHQVSKNLKEQDVPVRDMKIVMVPQNELALEPKAAVQILRLVDDLEEMDDVRQVFSNLEVTEEAVQAFAAAI
ncbi:MAG: YebC/PmpR family DNA-binding transcriptional regulator [Chloroflexota bacterium]|nr:YebC/PmpR family DNA-binding transcriptional regulator [Chloroflexota bacterium]